ncbi:MAG: DJ-1/PfpI family protein [Candidatus Sumerlaeia bacterium]|nr:DJ-1/PfpI family protein [Candidatus Sumerlaeia bacterium]
MSASPSETRLSALLLLYPGVEVLDAAGPFEILATATDPDGELLVTVKTVAEHLEPVEAVGGMRFVPDYTFENASMATWLIIPGGRGRRIQVANELLIEFLRQRGTAANTVLTVCTGAFLAARAGLLDGLRVTTHHTAREELRALGESFTVTDDRLIDNGRVVCAAGVASGIDGALHLLERTFDRATAERAAKRAEYIWK